MPQRISNKNKNLGAGGSLGTPENCGGILRAMMTNANGDIGRRSMGPRITGIGIRQDAVLGPMSPRFLLLPRSRCTGLKNSALPLPLLSISLQTILLLRSKLKHPLFRLVTSIEASHFKILVCFFSGFFSLLIGRSSRGEAGENLKSSLELRVGCK